MEQHPAARRTRSSSTTSPASRRCRICRSISSCTARSRSPSRPRAAEAIAWTAAGCRFSADSCSSSDLEPRVVHRPAVGAGDRRAARRAGAHRARARPVLEDAVHPARDRTSTAACSTTTRRRRSFSPSTSSSWWSTTSRAGASATRCSSTAPCATKRGAQSRLDDVIYSIVRENLGRHTLREIVNEKRSELMAEVTKRKRREGDATTASRWSTSASSAPTCPRRTS